MIKVIAKETGFLKGKLIKAGELFEVNTAKDVPAWAVKVDKNGEPKEPQAPKEPEKVATKEPEKIDEVVAPAEKTEPAEVKDAQDDEEDELDKLSEKEVEELYNKVTDELVEKNLIIEDAEKKTLVEQIREARKLLAPAEKTEQ